MIFVRLSLMMFIQFFIWSSWYVTAYLYLSKIGFGGPEIAWTYSVGPLAAMITPLFVGMIADRFFPSEWVLGALHLFGGGAMFVAASLMTVENPSPMIINLVFFIYMLSFFPTLSLTNSLALQNMQNPEKEFPLIRVFGTIGWIFGGWVISLQGWDASIRMFHVAAVSAIIMGVYSFTLPHTPPPAAGKKPTLREIFGLDALVLLRRKPFFIFILSSLLICIPLAFYYQMAGKFVDHAGMAAPAFKMSFGQMSEIFFMLVMPLFFAFLGVKWMLFVGMLAWVVRYALFSIGADDGVTWMLMSGILLHGICYDFFFVTGQIYTDRSAPKHIRGQAQGMLVLFTLGLGMFIGAQIAGQVEKHYTADNAEALNEQAAAVATQMDSLQVEVDDIYELTGKPWLARQISFFLPKSLSEAEVQRVDNLNEQIATLREERSDILLQTVDWKSVWFWPAVGAGVIMVFFALLFHDKPEKLQADPAEPIPAPADSLPAEQKPTGET